MDLNEFLQLDPLNQLKMLMNIGVLFPERECLNCKCKCALRKRRVPEKYSWRCPKCKKFYSVKFGSFFELFKLSIICTLQVIEYWAKERKLIDIQESLNISKPTAIKICRYLRQMTYLDLNKENFKCGGPQKIVEIDESVFNKVKYNKGKIKKIFLFFSNQNYYSKERI